MTDRFPIAPRLRLVLGLLSGGACGLLPSLASGQGVPTISQPVVQSVAPSPSRDLGAALARLASDPRNAVALRDAAEAALKLGDTDAAVGFLRRADEAEPGNARTKALMGKAYLASENPVDAIRAFDEAEKAGADTFAMAEDRALAYDLVGDNGRAQRWYQVALSRGPNDEITRRYAMSLAISGDRRGAEALLAPLIERQDRAAWRTRTFAMSVTGGPDEAIAIAYATMPQELAASISPYLRYMPRLTPAQQAAAANFGRFPRAADMGRDDPRVVQYAAANPRAPRMAEAGLIPAGQPLGGAAKAGTEKPSREARRRPGREERQRAEQKTVLAQAQRSPATAQGAAGQASAQPQPQAQTQAPVQPPTRPAAQPAPAPATAAGGAASALASAANPPSAPANAVPRPQVLSVLDLPPGAPKPTPAPTPAAASASAPVALAANASAATQVRAATPSPSPTPAPAPAPAPAPTASLAAAPPPSASAPDKRPPRFDLAQVPGSQSAPRPAPAPAPAPAPTTATATATAPAPVPAPASAPAPAPSTSVAVVQPTGQPSAEADTPPRPVDFAAMFRSFTPPPEERQQTVAAVDITRLPPKPAPKTVAADPRGERPDAPADVGRTPAKEPEKPAVKDARQAAKDTKEAKDAKAKAAEKPRKPAHPSRIWVQVLTGANRDVMDREWRRIVKEAPAAMRGQKPYITAWRSNFRLLTGPFESDAEAQDFVNRLRKAGVSSYQWTSPAGQAVDVLALK